MTTATPGIAAGRHCGRSVVAGATVHRLPDALVVHAAVAIEVDSIAVVAIGVEAVPVKPVLQLPVLVDSVGIEAIGVESFGVEAVGVKAVTVEPGAKLVEGPYVAETFPVAVEDDYIVVETK